MSKIFNLTAHKALWNWLSMNPEKEKQDWPGWKKNGGKCEKQSSNCFACEWSIGVLLKEPICTNCPLLWNRNGFCGVDYMEWSEAKYMDNDYKLASKLAEKIRDLPIREGVEYE